MFEGKQAEADYGGCHARYGQQGRGASAETADAEVPGFEEGQGLREPGGRRHRFRPTIVCSGSWGRHRWLMYHADHKYANWGLSEWHLLPGGRVALSAGAARWAGRKP